MDNNYDLTTKYGYMKAMSFLIKCGNGKYGKYALITSAILVVTFSMWFLYKAVSPKKLTKEKVELVKDLINAGKEKGFKKISIKVGYEVGINFDPSIEGIPLKFNIGNDGTMDIEVEYS